ncbi:MAG: BrnT family toxin [Acidobacteriaceae bacterium]
MFDWDEANIAHIANHDVQPHEAEEAYNSNPVYLDYAIEDGEERHREIGESLTGRLLVVISTMRGDTVRVVTAYPPDRPLRLTYLAFKESEQHGKENHS